MQAPKNKIDRKVRIEILRARAALEREQMCYLTQQLGSSLQPERLWDVARGRLTQGFSSSFSGMAKIGPWWDFVWSFGRRYPLLMSGASAIAGTLIGKKKWRLGAAALTAWRLFGAYQSLQESKQNRYVQAAKPKSSRIMGPF